MTKGFSTKDIDVSTMKGGKPVMDAAQHIARETNMNVDVFLRGNSYMHVVVQDSGNICCYRIASLKNTFTVVGAETVKTKFVEGIGTIRYKQPSMRDLRNLRKSHDPREIRLRLITLMLGRADPKITHEKVLKLDPTVANKLSDFLLGELTLALRRPVET